MCFFWCLLRLEEEQVYGAGALGDFPILHYVQNCEIKDNGLMACSWSLCDILTTILLGTFIDVT